MRNDCFGKGVHSMQTVNFEIAPVSVNQVLKDIILFTQGTCEEDVLVQSCSASPRNVVKNGVFVLLDKKAYGCKDKDCFFNDGDYYLFSDDEDTQESDEETLFTENSRKSPKMENFSTEEAVAIAIMRGAKAVVSREPLDGIDIPVFVVKDTREAFGILCHAIEGNPARSLKTIGITGTAGKTSTSYLIAGMLAESGNPVGLIGTLGIYDGLTMHPTRDTTPPANELAFWLAKMVENGCSHVILEISSEAIEQARLAGIELDAVCMTNIRRDHIDYHKTVENYRRTKMSIFKYAKPDGIAICNADDRVTNAILPLIEYPVLTVGIRDIAEVTGTIIETNRGEQTFLVNAGSEVVPVRSRMIGRENVYNSLIAFALAISLDIDIKDAARGIERVECVPGRLERIDCGQPFGVFIDCARTQESLGANLKALREVTSGKVYCIFGAGSELDPTKRPLLGRAMELYSDVPILSRDETPGTESVADSMEGILAGFVKSDKAKIILNRPDAIAWVLSNIGPEDSVLICGNGISNRSGIRKAFCDRVFTKQWLYENQPCLLESDFF